MSVVDRLAVVPLFAGLDRADLERICSGSREITLARGERLFAEGDPGDEAFVIVAGDVEIVKHSVGREILVAVRHAGEVIGEMALLFAEPRSATVRARTEVSAIVIPKRHLDELLDTSHTAARAMFGVLLTRWRETESRLRQNERMAQLGTLTAGLAHELNNPAAAVQRSAGELEGAVEAYAAARARLGADLPEAITMLIERPRRPLDALTRSDREAELEAWLEGHGVPEPWRFAGSLVAAGITGADLDGYDGDIPAAVAMLAAAAAAHDLLHQVREGSTRVSAIVKALKSYSFLDRAPIQEVDLVTGLEDTLLILRPKVRDLEVVRDFGEVPPFPAYGSELNQVWTNLIDNAADAVADGRGSTIILRTRREGDTVTVEVEDDGPGIPDDVLPRIFDAFFTTKGPGKGTGLGLDISYGIVVHRHGGDITVDSEPGRTVFRVSLPFAGPPA